MGGPRYLEDPYADRLATRALAAAPMGGVTEVELEDTILHPGGGGQPPDRGWIAGLPVLRARREKDRLLYAVKGELGVGPVEVCLDRERRYDHMQQHTAQHLLTALALARLGWRTVGFGIGAHSSYIDVDRKGIGWNELEGLEEMAAAEVRAARPVRWYWIDPAEMERMGVRSRRLPQDHAGPVRIVEIEGIDRNTCAGTHVGCTAEVEGVAFLATEPMHGGTRLHWVAGGRLRRWVAGRRNVLRRLRDVLGAADADLPEIATRRLEELARARRETRRLRAQLAARIAEGLRAPAGSVVAAALEDGEIVGAVASALAGAPEVGVHLLVAPDGTAALALGAEVPVPAEVLWTVAAAELEARGGGRGRLCRGRAARPDRVEAARAALEAALAAAR